MKRTLFSVTLIITVLLSVGCTATCKGDSCSRPQSSEAKWWSGGRRTCVPSLAPQENGRIIKPSRWNDEPMQLASLQALVSCT